MNTQKMTKYAIGRNPYPKNTEAHNETKVISFEKLEQLFEKLEGFKDLGIKSVYRSDKTKALNKLEKIGFKPLAWTPNVRYLYYNPKIDLLIKEIEGDLFVIDKPTKEYLDKCLSHYPKAEVSLGEKYDSRFNTQ